MEKLKPADCELFDLIRDAAFSNPFSEEREALDARIAGVEAGLPYEQVMARAAKHVAERLVALGGAGSLNPSGFEGEDRERVKYAVLFDVYHRHRTDFDDHINHQLASGDTPLKVPFASEVLAALMASGFPLVIACSYLSMFFQLRRAFHFIDRGLTGSGSSMRRLRGHLWNNVFTHDMQWYEQFLWNRMEDFSTLLLGETGTGKGNAAAAIGRSGFIAFDEARGRFTRSFTTNLVALNLSQFPESLIESELFGHRKGAFTGAVEDHEGMFARCPSDGAIFLDEIGEVSIPVQIKLLQVLQDRCFSAVGSHEQCRFEGRVIAATNRNLSALRSEGLFRDDFYYRLCSDVITVPSLNQRIQEAPEELDELLAGIITRVTGEARESVVERVGATLRSSVPVDYTWPGNVRELEQAVRRILITKTYETVPVVTPASPADRLRDELERGALTAAELLSRYCVMLYDRMGSYGDVARVLDLDWRTVKKYVAASTGTR